MFSSNCLVKKYARNRKRAACMFFRSAKNVFISPRYDGLADRVHSARGQLNRRITKFKITRNVNAPLYNGLMTARTVIAVNQTVVSLLFNTRVYGEK